MNCTQMHKLMCIDSKRDKLFILCLFFMKVNSFKVKSQHYDD